MADSKKKIVTDFDVKGKRVLVRVDFNVPLDKASGEITDDKRIVGALPTIRYLVEQGAKTILLSHLGRPKGFEDKFSLKPAAVRLSELLGQDITLASDIIGDDAKAKVAALQDGDVLMLENIRFHKEETKNDKVFAKTLAAFGDLYINDAFGTAHRAHASTAGLADFLPAAAGFLIEKELKSLGEAIDQPARPFVAILGGAKVSDKIGVIGHLLDKVDTLIVGGAMAYTFFAAKGFCVGTSLVEPDKVDLAKQLMDKAAEKGVNFLLPVDTVVAKTFAADAAHRAVPSDQIPDDEMGLDIGPETIKLFSEAISGAKTVVWNGPVGVFEFEAFAVGTKAIAEAVASSGAVSIIGGGDSAAAIEMLGFADRVTHISTGGGASLELLEGKILPGIDCLDDQNPRRTLVAGNWKMNKGLPSEASALIADLLPLVADSAAKIVVAPPFTALDAALKSSAYTNVRVAAQNGYAADSGAYTGEISMKMLADLGVPYVLIGHSERRQYFGETNETVNEKVKAARGWGLRPIVCVGETLEEREAGKTFDIVSRQVEVALEGVSEQDMHFITVAYEPVWAIGTGKVASDEQAEEVCADIRRCLAASFGHAIADATPILYGGSVNAKNAAGLFAMPNIDGGLVGGASLKANDFAEIARGAKR